MDYRVVWVHGLGPILPGYSLSWDQVYNPYLHFPATDFIEVDWAAVISSTMSGDNVATNTIAVPLTAQEQFAEAQVRHNLSTVLLARTTAQAHSPALVGEWSQVTQQVATGQVALPPWVLNPDPYIGEFVKYLVNRSIRTAVKQKVKEQLRPLANSGAHCSLIAHSWGTVVAYESLIDLEKERPTFHLAHLFTLGSPLWLVQSQLDDPSGRKPHNVANWVNIHAQGDVIGAGLTPGFRVDADDTVANFGDGDPHVSYFVAGNVAVERDIVAATLLAERSTWLSAGQQQQATDTWKSTQQILQAAFGAQAPTGTGIYQSWEHEYMNGYNHGGPLTLEFPTVNWNSQPIVCQYFAAGDRCEWDGSAHWYHG